MVGADAPIAAGETARVARGGGAVGAANGRRSGVPNNTMGGAHVVGVAEPHRVPGKARGPLYLSSSQCCAGRVVGGGEGAGQAHLVQTDESQLGLRNL